MKIVWALFSERGSFGEKTLVGVYEDEDDARQAMQQSHFLSGKSVELIPSSRKQRTNDALNELAGHEEDAST